MERGGAGASSRQKFGQAGKTGEGGPPRIRNFGMVPVRRHTRFGGLTKRQQVKGTRTRLKGRGRNSKESPVEATSFVVQATLPCI